MKWLQNAQQAGGHSLRPTECTSALVGALSFVFLANLLLVYLFGTSKCLQNILLGSFELGVLTT